MAVCGRGHDHAGAESRKTANQAGNGDHGKKRMKAGIAHQGGEDFHGTVLQVRPQTCGIAFEKSPSG